MSGCPGYTRWLHFPEPCGWGVTGSDTVAAGFGLTAIGGGDPAPGDATVGTVRRECWSGWPAPLAPRHAICVVGAPTNCLLLRWPQKPSPARLLLFYDNRLHGQGGGSAGVRVAPNGNAAETARPQAFCYPRLSTEHFGRLRPIIRRCCSEI